MMQIYDKNNKKIRNEKPEQILRARGEKAPRGRG